MLLGTLPPLREWGAALAHAPSVARPSSTMAQELVGSSAGGIGAVGGAARPGVALRLAEGWSLGAVDGVALAAGASVGSVVRVIAGVGVRGKVAGRIMAELERIMAEANK